MIKTVQTEIFSKWLKALNDVRAKAKILVRIHRLESGNPDDIAPVNEGVSEMKIDYGPGYRVYFKRSGKEIVILLCDGDKSTQKKDIELAKNLAKR